MSVQGSDLCCLKTCHRSKVKAHPVRNKPTAAAYTVDDPRSLLALGQGKARARACATSSVTCLARPKPKAHWADGTALEVEPSPE
ncbi:hypothetical protein AAFF_G00039900 [Aldrovandia affinis]|uniref:Uncharacterized protein n=1 Tax=Aldrovandia affinis TaxID=143900 RepID=A0AAD7WGE6_9TELE|nr:hypothetical protein AAFF_G00039900 [Aldrovandia affinis]